MSWETIGRPGVFGDKKSQIFGEYDSEYGLGQWRIVHQYGEDFLPFLEVCGVYEEAYFLDSFGRVELWENLRKTAKEVYDIDKSDLKSGLYYGIQTNVGIHIQDIAIRNVFLRRGWDFEGDELVQIRSTAEPFGSKLTPGRVQFHKPQCIVSPHMKGWWDEDSVEDFYQSNKLLQVWV